MVRSEIVDVGVLVASGKDLEIVDINNNMRAMLRWPDEFGSEKVPKYVNDLLPTAMQAAHSEFFSKAIMMGSLPDTLMHPLRGVEVMTANREEPIRGSLSVGLLSDALPLSSADSLFYAVFVVDSDTETGASRSSSRMSSSAYDEDEEPDDRPPETGASPVAGGPGGREDDGSLWPSPQGVWQAPVRRGPSGGSGLESLWENVWECTVGSSPDPPNPPRPQGGQGSPGPARQSDPSNPPDWNATFVAELLHEGDGTGG
eukprot:CAMPEP_0172152154 /NCGR_PEP_ID=MMETSP1050-20130122/667_1 /TAXON_ID=233186 /ORGANISM="Cryptomonas curvata, Strain CCAP979/52" /LENGTH=257 /DNA_ID=CAMNT_0012820419 /DNA_START=677 /DNA_END=1447 /DNA_ORIENTATION=+